MLQQQLDDVHEVVSSGEMKRAPAGLIEQINRDLPSFDQQRRHVQQSIVSGEVQQIASISIAQRPGHLRAVIDEHLYEFYQRRQTGLVRRSIRVEEIESIPVSL